MQFRQSARFSNVRSLLSLFILQLFSVFVRRQLLCPAHTQRDENWWWGYHCLAFYCTEDLFLFPQCIYLFNHLFAYIWTHAYIYFVHGVIPQYYYSLLKLFLLATGGSFRSAPVSLSCSFPFLSTSLLFVTLRCSRFILYFSAPVPELAVSPRSPRSFYRRMVLRNQDWQVGENLIFIALQPSPCPQLGSKSHVGWQPHSPHHTVSYT